jgi:hypothetical protein
MPSRDPPAPQAGVIGSIEGAFTILFINQSVGLAFSRQCLREAS